MKARSESVGYLFARAEMAVREGTVMPCIFMGRINESNHSLLLTTIPKGEIRAPTFSQ